MRRAVIYLAVLAAMGPIWAGSTALALEESGICAKVRVRLSQDVALTRTAFKATLEITNAPENVALENVNVTLDIRTGDDVPANTLFGIRAPELTGIGDVSGHGTIPPGSIAQAVWIIIPTRDAAPEAPTVYTVGGTLSYLQDGQQISMPLWPAPILVKPDPLIYLDYFWVRDVYADDARTPQIEPSESFPLGLIIKNQGKGTAYNVRITSSQPEIIENEKGLLIAFQIISSQINDQEVSPSLAVNLGNLEPAATSVVRWNMTSTLAGTFSEYSARLEHIDELGDPRLSLIEPPAIHELNHCVQIDIPADDNKPDFLVNDLPDDDHMPDRVYSSDGTNADVAVAAGAGVTGSLGFGNLEIQLTATCPAGWVYIEADDLGQEMYDLVKVVRSDGREIMVDENAWTTHRTTCPEGVGCMRIHKVHLFDWDSTGSYTLFYQPKASPGSYSLADVKGLGDGEWVEMGCAEGLVVTAVYPEAFYVERRDRAIGIRVSKIGSVVPGMQVALTGQVATTPWMERYIMATGIQECSGELVELLPLAMPTRSLGGGSFLFDIVSGAGQRAVTAFQPIKNSHWSRSTEPLPIQGLNNLGLLVRTCGKVVWTDTDRGTFYIDDGSGFDDFMYPNAAQNMPPGVKVTMPEWGLPLPEVGSQVSVTGISSCYVSDGYIFRQLRARGEADVVVIQ